MIRGHRKDDPWRRSLGGHDGAALVPSPYGVDGSRGADLVSELVQGTELVEGRREIPGRADGAFVGFVAFDEVGDEELAGLAPGEAALVAVRHAAAAVTNVEHQVFDGLAHLAVALRPVVAGAGASMGDEHEELGGLARRKPGGWVGKLVVLVLRVAVVARLRLCFASPRRVAASTSSSPSSLWVHQFLVLATSRRAYERRVVLDLIRILGDVDPRNLALATLGADLPRDRPPRVQVRGAGVCLRAHRAGVLHGLRRRGCRGAAARELARGAGALACVSQVAIGSSCGCRCRCGSCVQVQVLWFQVATDAQRVQGLAGAPSLSLHSGKAAASTPTQARWRQAGQARVYLGAPRQLGASGRCERQRGSRS
mmetsp:Transcript_33253/g.96320  ORF Transcript_33253/g.96320 Transcript_33253/m.96320 type:complete len:369 (+) Transcript_33253:448-1554(+)